MLLDLPRNRRAAASLAPNVHSHSQLQLELQGPYVLLSYLSVL